MYEEFIRNRIDELRMKKNLSEYQLGLALGKSQGYIQSITSGRNLPSMSAFLDICAYFEITPAEFFDPEIKSNDLFHSVLNHMKMLSEEDLMLLSMVLERITKS